MCIAYRLKYNKELSKIRLGCCFKPKQNDLFMTYGYSSSEIMVLKKILYL